MNATHRYGIVRAIALILKVLAWIALALGLVAAIVIAAGGGSGNSLLNALRSMGMVVGPIVGIVWFVQLFALGSILSLLVDIEENTRALSEQPSVAPVDLA